MKSHYRVVVIGGGVVGASIIYHLSKMGWPDIALIERCRHTRSTFLARSKKKAANLSACI
jgi:dimethylglycine dehydrogenase